MGKILPDHISDACVQKLMQEGFLPREEAGIVNIGLKMVGGKVVASAFPSEVIFQQPEMLAGDQLLTVDGKHPDSLMAANAMLFGKVGSEVHLLLGRGELRFPLIMKRLGMADATLATALPEVVPVQMDGYGALQSTQEPSTEEEPHQLTTDRHLPVNSEIALAQPITSSPVASIADRYAQPLPLLKPLIMAGDQICHLRSPFIDVARAQEVRGNTVLVKVDYVQLANPPYTNFGRSDSPPHRESLSRWHPCSGSSPVLLSVPHGGR